MSFEEDPEVLADIRLRAATERDRTRSRGLGVYNWTPPEIVSSWPCRRPGCKGRFDVQAEDLERFNMFNRELAKRNEELIRPSQVAYCDECRREYVRSAANRRRAQVDRMVPVIRQLKDSEDPESERVAIKQLETWGHPDVAGLVTFLKDRRKMDKAKNKSTRGSV